MNKISDKKLLDLCNKYLTYNPETGVFTNKINRGSAKKGCESGWLDCGYRRIRLRDKFYRAHRLAFLMTFGNLPKMIDHINHDKVDNRIVNLRSCTSRQNNINRGPGKNSSSRYKGVSWDKSRGKWQANIRIDGKSKSLGYFQDEKEAAETYDDAAVKYHGEFACTNKSLGLYREEHQ